MSILGKIEELLVRKGLYEPMEITYEDREELSKLISTEIPKKIKIDCYCPECGEKRVFIANSIHDSRFNRGAIVLENEEENIDKAIFRGYLNKRYTLEFHCSYNEKHILYIDLITTDNKMFKIGQYPSEADLFLPKIKNYEKVLDPKLYREFKDAIILHANGFGIGSFVYLRRIIEFIVNKQFIEVSEYIKTTPEAFNNLKFKDKIELLADYLPKSLITNRNMYSIVSKGIHELSEEECIKYFNFLKSGIELILDDTVAKKERMDKEREVENFVAELTGEIRSKR